jgi:peptidoglycan/xylan/chitin deacetylase (PgdA/CDA1 family)
MDKLLNADHQIISLSDIKKKINLSDTSIVLTFDDGYSDLYRYVAEYLFSKNVPFTIFVTTGWLNSHNYLSIEQLKDLSNNPLCTIGSHTINHPILRQINNIESIQEIKNSKCTLEDIISKEIEYFAYPYGSHYAVSKRDIENVKKSGYSLAFSTINSFLSEKALTNKWFLPRINVTEQNFQRIE